MMDAESWTKVIVVLSWVVILSLIVIGVRRKMPAIWRQHRVVVIIVVLALLLPLGTLSIRYGLVSCDSLDPETACVCYALQASHADAAAEKQENFAKADDLCPGHAAYRNGAGR